MPNKRLEGKKNQNVWMTEPQRKSLLKLAESINAHKSDVVKASILKFKSLSKTEQKSWISKVDG